LHVRFLHRKSASEPGAYNALADQWFRHRLIRCARSSLLARGRRTASCVVALRSGCSHVEDKAWREGFKAKVLTRFGVG
jgi:hypothetical protein